MFRCFVFVVFAFGPLYFLPSGPYEWKVLVLDNSPFSDCFQSSYHFSLPYDMLWLLVKFSLMVLDMHQRLRYFACVLIDLSYEMQLNFSLVVLECYLYEVTVRSTWLVQWETLLTWVPEIISRHRWSTCALGDHPCDATINVVQVVHVTI